QPHVGGPVRMRVQVPFGVHLGEVRRYPARRRPTGPAGGDQPVGERGGAGALQLPPAGRSRLPYPHDGVLDLREGAVEVEKDRRGRCRTRRSVVLHGWHDTDRRAPPLRAATGSLEGMTSPAERYDLARRRMAEAARAPALTDFAAELGFELDPFQRDACAALERGSGVLVCAPTGAGKTVVGEFAVHLALAQGRKCFYTTPIKALSNQKFHDLVERYGAARVGLLTGDNSINGDAAVVVMTTEVLRNVLYAGSSTLSG